MVTYVYISAISVPKSAFRKPPGFPKLYKIKLLFASSFVENNLGYLTMPKSQYTAMAIFRDPSRFLRYSQAGFSFAKIFASKRMLLDLGYQTLKTAALYLVPVRSYSKNNRLP